MAGSPNKLPGPTPSPASLRVLRDAVSQLAQRGTAGVEAVRTAFISGDAPLRQVSSGSKADFINRFADRGVPENIIRSTAQFGLSTSPVGTTSPPPKVELDFVEIGVDRLFGSLDAFYTRTVFSTLLTDLNQISYFRVLRATDTDATEVQKPAFSALIDLASTSQVRTKSAQGFVNSAGQAGQVGVGNKLLDFVGSDSFSGQRVVIGSSSLRPLPAVPNTNRGVSQAGLISIQNADRSVLEDVAFYVNQRTLTPAQQVQLPLTVGRKSGVHLIKGETVGSPSSIVVASNFIGFSEVARLPARLARVIGNYAELEYFDPSVVHGGSYSYCVVPVTKDGFSGPRTRIVRANVVRNVPPESPTISYSVISCIPHFSIRCSGSFIDHVEVFRRGGAIPATALVISSQDSLIDRIVPNPVLNGFCHIGDVGTGVNRAAPFVDRMVSPGQHLDYRFYTVDSFGLKSATPFSCSISIPDVGLRTPLSIPSITAEQGSGGRAINVLMQSDDPRVIGFVLQRRDRSISEKSFRGSTQPDYFTFGRTTAKRSRSRFGPALNQNSNGAWNGVFVAASGSASFVDLTVEFDRVYQYSTFGVDVRGNATPSISDSPVFVAVKPVIDPPVSLTGTVSVGATGPQAIVISWSGGTVDFSPNDLIGDQDVLSASSQRSVFQVERRTVGEFIWQAMPAVTGTSFVDRFAAGKSPKFRPPYPIPGEQYDYRVIAMQSGAFISTHTQPIRIPFLPEVVAPDFVWVRTSPTQLRPLEIVISWEYDGIFIDRWEVERAVTNKLFGAKITSMDSQQARSLNYAQVASVPREASRGIGLSMKPPLLDSRTSIGNRFFIDRNVTMANSYFYRVRAVDSVNRVSDWTYGGIALSDSPFDRKFLSSLSDDEKTLLALDPRPLSGWEAE